MESIGLDFDFLEKYAEKKLISIQSAPQWPAMGNHVSDEVALNFDDGSQLIVSSSFANVDTFFDVDEDVVFGIREDSGYEPFCNIGEMKMESILVNEVPESITVVFDEISYCDKSISDKLVVFPVGLFIKTSTRTIGICRDMLNAVWLDANYFDANFKLMYSLDSRWGDFEDVDSFMVRRIAKEYCTGTVLRVEQKQFC
ncbi:MAG: hypothetical protein MJ057_03070 [Sphaerochaetaceae bacterium]|nr:hypothetical protein [Sphaerochaetaceae bacterium]